MKVALNPMVLTVLFVTQCPPYPLNGGERIRCYNLIESLAMNLNVVVLAPRPAVDCELSYKISAWYGFPKPPKLPMNIGSVSYYSLVLSSALVRCLETVCQKHKPHVVWFDYGLWGLYSPVVRRFGVRTIMGTHNVESNLTKQRLNSKPLSLGYLRLCAYYQAQRWHESHLFSRFDRIISVSERDRQYHAQWVGDSKSKLVPNYINEKWYKSSDKLINLVPCKYQKVVITANFYADPNKLGTEWFLKKVWSLICQQFPNVHLNLVGRFAENIFIRMDKPTNVNCIGEVPSVVPYLKQARVAVVPILHGSGTRFKILEALACGIPVVSTTIGAEGIDVVSGESILLADSANEFARSVVELLKDDVKHRKLSENGLVVLKREYGFERNTD
ncbi:glycosyltransferase family 4 protein, partial [Coleofasciculus sp.]|uniref:glycosyltransferase family 4 protein n=1 Tax=Coleofasciculus sp. TaxID=3100458 RepID=UPI0039F7BA91